MSEKISKRLINSLARIKRTGGIVLVHHTAGGWRRLPANQRPIRRCAGNRKASFSAPHSPWPGRAVRRGRSDIPCGERMSKFADDLRARLAEINAMIPHAKVAERRALQRERTDLEDKLRRVEA